jgi:hypothetical protein
VLVGSRERGVLRVSREPAMRKCTVSLQALGLATSNLGKNRVSHQGVTSAEMAYDDDFDDDPGACDVRDDDELRAVF